ncbi:MAG: hypothetical protein NC086_10800 [Alistipes sp.]|nr:hypothetical protein [Alistipes sp.]
MKCMLKIEWNRLLRSPSFWITLIIGMIISFWQYHDVGLYVLRFQDTILAKNRTYGTLMPNGVFEKWIGGEGFSFWSYTFFMILPILCTLPFSASLYTDRRSGIIKNYFVRNEKKNYYLAKYIVTFLASGAVIVLPLAVNLLLTSATLPSLLPEASTGTYPLNGSSMWAELFYTRPYQYVVQYLLLIFVFSGLIACFSLSLGIISDNVFTILSFPFIYCLFSYAVFNNPRVYRFVPILFLNPAQTGSFIRFDAILIYMVILVAVSLLAIVKGVKSETI